VGITHILCCAANIKPRFPEDFTYETLNCLDSPNQGILSFVDQANNFISSAVDENKVGEPPVNKVLIHCFAGKSRATSFLLAFLIKVRKQSIKDSLEAIHKVRPIAAPNPGFMI